MPRAYGYKDTVELENDLIVMFVPPCQAGHCQRRWPRAPVSGNPGGTESTWRGGEGRGGEGRGGEERGGEGRGGEGRGGEGRGGEGRGGEGRGGEGRGGEGRGGEEVFHTVRTRPLIHIRKFIQDGKKQQREIKKLWKKLESRTF